MIRLIPDYEDRRHCCLNASREAEVFQIISLLGTTPGVQINFQAITGLQAIKIDDFMLKCRSRDGWCVVSVIMITVRIIP